MESIVGADGVEVDTGEIEGVATSAAGGEEEAEEPAPVKALV